MAGRPGHLSGQRDRDIIKGRDTGTSLRAGRPGHHSGQGNRDIIQGGKTETSFMVERLIHHSGQGDRYIKLKTMIYVHLFKMVSWTHYY